MDAQDKMVDALISEGALRDADWIEVFRDVPRHAFIPDRAKAGDVTLDRGTDPDLWMTYCYMDEAIVTQVDDGQPDGRGIPTSSASAPSVVAEMLEALEVFDGARVLEIGTGTGWNAALLSWRLGSDNVTSLEVDPEIAITARRALYRAGYSPTVATVDGAAGFPLNAPYDRVISTCAVRDVPLPWIQQTKPGGLVVTPWSPGTGTGSLLKLRVNGDGTASGRCGEALSFMEMRAQREQPTRPPDLGEEPTGTTITSIAPDSIMFGEATFAMRVTLPDVQIGMRRDHVWIGRTRDGSWARVYLDQPHRVEYGGPANLWDDVQGAMRWWDDHDQPGPDRFGVTIDTHGQHAWLDRPGTETN